MKTTQDKVLGLIENLIEDAALDCSVASDYVNRGWITIYEPTDTDVLGTIYYHFEVHQVTISVHPADKPVQNVTGGTGSEIWKEHARFGVANELTDLLAKVEAYVDDLDEAFEQIRKAYEETHR
jgi:hypothetical protein